MSASPPGYRPLKPTELNGARLTRLRTALKATMEQVASTAGIRRHAVMRAEWDARCVRLTKVNAERVLRALGEMGASAWILDDESVALMDRAVKIVLNKNASVRAFAAVRPTERRR